MPAEKRREMTAHERAKLALEELIPERLVSSIATQIDAHTADLRALLAQQAARADEWEKKAMDVEHHPVVVALLAERDAYKRMADEAGCQLVDVREVNRKLAEQRDAALAREARLREALEPFARVYRKGFAPRAWPRLAEYRKADAALSGGDHE
jgi:hypothetical protein